MIQKLLHFKTEHFTLRESDNQYTIDDNYDVENYFAFDKTNVDELRSLFNELSKIETFPSLKDGRNV